MLILLSWIVLWWRFSSYLRGNVKWQSGWGHFSRFFASVLCSLIDVLFFESEKLVTHCPGETAAVIESLLSWQATGVPLASDHVGCSVDGGNVICCWVPISKEDGSRQSDKSVGWVAQWGRLHISGASGELKFAFIQLYSVAWNPGIEVSNEV